MFLSSAELVYNSSTSKDMGCSPFEIDLGWKPKSALDIISGRQSSVESVNDFNSLSMALEKYHKTNFGAR